MHLMDFAFCIPDSLFRWPTLWHFFPERSPSISLSSPAYCPFSGLELWRWLEIWLPEEVDNVRRRTIDWGTLAGDSCHKANKNNADIICIQRKIAETGCDPRIVHIGVHMRAYVYNVHFHIYIHICTNIAGRENMLDNECLTKSNMGGGTRHAP